ncbi:hypothetical protein PVAP13_5NG559350, partial [Panicum virgatum]
AADGRRAAAAGEANAAGRQGSAESSRGEGRGGGKQDRDEESGRKTITTIWEWEGGGGGCGRARTGGRRESRRKEITGGAAGRAGAHADSRTGHGGDGPRRALRRDVRRGGWLSWAGAGPSDGRSAARQTAARRRPADDDVAPGGPPTWAAMIAGARANALSFETGANDTVKAQRHLSSVCQVF